MKRLFLLTVCSALLISVQIYAKRGPASSIDSRFVDTINQFCLHQLTDNQLLFLGEGQHNDHVFCKAVIGLLNYWVDEAESSDDAPVKLTLVLEYSGDFGRQLQEFISSGNVESFGIEIQGRTLNTLEFFYDLRTFSRRIEEVQKRRALEFAILCPEQNIAFDTPREERDRIAATERDSNVTLTILSYVKQHPDRKLVAFYGGGHMSGKPPHGSEVTPWGLQLKNAGLSIYTITLNHFGTQFPFPLPFSEIGSDFLITTQSCYDMFGGKELGSDAAIFFREPAVQTITLKDIPSSLVLKKALGYARQSIRFRPALKSLWYRYTGEDISKMSDPITHISRNIANVNTDKAIWGGGLFDNLFREFAAKNTPRPEINKLMFEITCFGNVLSRKPMRLNPDQSAEDLWREIIEKYHRQIMVHLYTSLLFYGTEAERSVAESRLRELTGKDFTSSSEWLKYLREL